MKSKYFFIIGGVLAAGFVSTIAFAKDHRVLLELDKGNFTAPTAVNNPWMPLEPGVQLIYDGVVVEDGEEIPHRVIFTVTDLTKIINGIETRVIWDRDFSKNKLLESELTFFAQDDDGNVWHLGQHREVYDETEFVGGRTWLIGHLEGAKAGIMMKANPKVGAASYSQGFAPAPFNWTDRARLSKTGVSFKVAYGSFDDVLVIEEFNEEEPGAFQLKYYAKGVGNIAVGWTGDDDNKETLELVEVRRLSAEEITKASAEALELEKRAYIYATTPPARRNVGDTGKSTRQAAVKISNDELMKIAVGAVPGKAIDVAIEKKLGANRYVVEVLSAADGGAEVDVIIDMATHKVLRIDR